MCNLSETRCRRVGWLLQRRFDLSGELWDDRVDERPRTGAPTQGSWLAPLFSNSRKALSQKKSGAVGAPSGGWARWLWWVDPAVVRFLMVELARWILLYWENEGSDPRPRATVEAMERSQLDGQQPADWKRVLDSPALPYNDCRAVYMGDASDCIAWAAHYIKTGKRSSAAASLGAACSCLDECSGEEAVLGWIQKKLPGCYQAARAEKGQA